MNDEQFEPLVNNARFIILHKNTGDEDSPVMRFAGIASDERPDLSPQQEAILRKNLDLTYAQQRGFVNWDHSRSPDDQIGYLTKAVVIPPSKVEEYAALLGTELSPTASVYVEGELYKSVPKARQVFDIMKSVSPGENVGLGLSLDGSAIREKDSGAIQKAIVRGVAITPSPAHTKTFCSLRKSLCSIEQLSEENGVTKGLNYDEAVMTLMKMRPHLTYGLAKRVVDYTIEQKRSQ